MHRNTSYLFRHIAVLLLAVTALVASAQEAQIRKVLGERLRDIPRIDELTKTPIPGIWEVRIGTEIFYTDERGDFLFQGELFDTRTRTNLTEERIKRLTAIDFGSLPLKDAIVARQGSGSRKLVVFADPNCSYCKRLERDLMAVKDVTIYTFLYPILGADSTEKSRAIWCATDPMKAWRDWMIDGVAPPKVTGRCDDAAIARNVALGQTHRGKGTPLVVYEDGTRTPGAVPVAEIEKRLKAATAAVSRSSAVATGGTASQAPPNRALASASAARDGSSDKVAPDSPLRVAAAQQSGAIRQVPECVVVQVNPKRDFRGTYSEVLVMNKCAYPVAVLGCIDIPGLNRPPFVCHGDMITWGTKVVDPLPNGWPNWIGTTLADGERWVARWELFGPDRDKAPYNFANAYFVACPRTHNGRAARIGKASVNGLSVTGECMFDEDFRRWAQLQ